MSKAKGNIAKWAGALAVSVLVLPSYAADIRPMIKAGYDFGGETLVTVVFTDGSRDSIKANEGLFFGGGASIVNDTKDMEIELTLSYKFQTITANNGDVDWTRWPLEALVFYRLPQVRVGGGLTYHLNPKLSGSGVVGGLDVKFQNALGFVLQADYRLTDRANLGVRYTSLEYTVTGGGAGAAKSNGIGITFSGSF